MSEENKFKAASDTTTELFKKIYEVQVGISPALKDGANPHFKSKYATIDSILDALKEPLFTADLTVSHFPALEGLIQRITHIKTGEWIETYLKFEPFLQQSGPQALAGMITYMRRYMLTSTFMMATEDDDGETAEGRGRSQTTSAPTPTPPSAPLSQSNGHVNLGEILNALESAADENELVAELDRYNGFRATCDDEQAQTIERKITSKRMKFKEGRK